MSAYRVDTRRRRGGKIIGEHFPRGWRNLFGAAEDERRRNIERLAQKEISEAIINLDGGRLLKEKIRSRLRDEWFVPDEEVVEELAGELLDRSETYNEPIGRADLFF